MAEYIKREAAIRAVQGQRSPCRSPAQNRMLDCLKAAVIRISAADVAPVVHGRWIQVDATKCRCSHCDIIAFIALYPHGDKNFCPNCGAKMDGGADHEAG